MCTKMEEEEEEGNAYATTSHRRVLVCPRTSKSRDRTISACSEYWFVFRSGRNRFWSRFRVFCLLSVKVCSWYKTHLKTGNLAGVWYVSILSVPGIQVRPVTVSFEAFSGHKTMFPILKIRIYYFEQLDTTSRFGLSLYFTNRVELLVEYTLHRVRSKMM